MPALKVEEIHPKGIAYKWIADDWKKQGFKEYPFLVDKNNSIMAMYPYTNSHDTGKIDQTTTSVFVKGEKWTPEKGDCEDEDLHEIRKEDSRL